VFLFLKLILAHLIADFILQFEEIYQLKVRSFLGQLLHVLIHGLVSLILLYPYLNKSSIWLFTAALVLIHLTQDLIKYHFTKKTPANTFVYFMTDQACHLGVLSAIFLLPVSREIRGFSCCTLIDSIYRNDLWTLLAIFFITLTFAGSYVLNAFSKSYLKDRSPLYLISSPEMAHAILERSLIAWIFFSSDSPWRFLVIPCAGLLRIPFKLLRERMAFLLSLIYALLVSMFFQRIFRIL